MTKNHILLLSVRHSTLYLFLFHLRNDGHEGEESLKNFLKTDFLIPLIHPLIKMTLFLGGLGARFSQIFFTSGVRLNRIKS